jgi:hypothetical protein
MTFCPDDLADYRPLIVLGKRIAGSKKRFRASTPDIASGFAVYGTKQDINMVRRTIARTSKVFIFDFQHTAFFFLAFNLFLRVG